MDSKNHNRPVKNSRIEDIKSQTQETVLCYYFKSIESSEKTQKKKKKKVAKKKWDKNNFTPVIKVNATEIFGRKA